jgi:DNA-binding NarL/FixJ family response regulator
LLVVDDDSITRYGIRQVLLDESINAEVCAEAGNAATALHAMRVAKPDMAIVDLWLPNCDGLQLLKSLLAERATLKVLVLSRSHELHRAVRTIRAGAKGYVTKQEPTKIIAEAVSAVLAGGTFLSPQLSGRHIYKTVDGAQADLHAGVGALTAREREVFTLIAAGASCSTIARRFGISPKTVECHFDHIRDKLGFPNGRIMRRFAADWRVTTETLMGVTGELGHEFRELHQPEVDTPLTVSPVSPRIEVQVGKAAIRRSSYSRK